MTSLAKAYDVIGQGTLITSGAPEIDFAIPTLLAV
jgi:hypothetical protein